MGFTVVSLVFQGELDDQPLSHVMKTQPHSELPALALNPSARVINTLHANKSEQQIEHKTDIFIPLGLWLCFDGDISLSELKIALLC